MEKKKLDSDPLLMLSKKREKRGRKFADQCWKIVRYVKSCNFLTEKSRNLPSHLRNVKNFPFTEEIANSDNGKNCLVMETRDDNETSWEVSSIELILSLFIEIPQLTSTYDDSRREKAKRNSFPYNRHAGVHPKKQTLSHHLLIKNLKSHGKVSSSRELKHKEVCNEGRERKNN